MDIELESSIKALARAEADRAARELDARGGEWRLFLYPSGEALRRLGDLIRDVDPDLDFIEPAVHLFNSTYIARARELRAEREGKYL